MWTFKKKVGTKSRRIFGNGTRYYGAGRVCFRLISQGSIGTQDAIIYSMSKLILFFFLVLIIGSGAYYLGTKGSLNKIRTVSNSILLPAISVPSNWKTYSNTQLGFTIAYPQEATINSGQYSSGGPNDFLSAITIELNNSKIKTIPGPLDGYVINITTGDFIAPEKGEIRLTTASNVATHYYQGDKEVGSIVTPMTITKLAGREAYTYTHKDAGPAGGSGKGYDDVNYFVNKDEAHVFWIEVIYDSFLPQNLEQYKKAADDIIQTLRFN